MWFSSLEMTLWHFHKESDPLWARSGQSSDLSQDNIMNFCLHTELQEALQCYCKVQLSSTIQSTCPCSGKYYLNAFNLISPYNFLKGGCGEGKVGLFAHIIMIGWKGTASSCTRGGSGWTLGKTSSPKEQWGTGTGCPGKWLSHPSWTCSRNV